jgi:hypothetical protein
VVEKVPTGGELTDGWSDELSLAAIAVLLIALDQKPTFRLVKERASGYFAISADTLQRGVDELRDAGLLHIDQRRIAASKLRQGWTLVNEYRLLGAFAKRERPPVPALGTVSGGRLRQSEVARDVTGDVEGGLSEASTAHS